MKVLKKLLELGMLEFTATASEFPLKLFAVWQVVGEIQRLIMDGRVPNSFFLTPSIEHTSGDDLARMQVARDRLLEVAKRCPTTSIVARRWRLCGHTSV